MQVLGLHILLLPQAAPFGRSLAVAHLQGSTLMGLRGVVGRVLGLKQVQSQVEAWVMARIVLTRVLRRAGLPITWVLQAVAGICIRG